ncbi:MAG: S-adenosylmethionine:tRNA ribosyltransferase-isomerase [Tannerellaceae bacterium]|jgi:S-adenosylmethionine:tRNA ribosyltransferase-isomerase|nr:S-adenosylmethionine:tRNA ribosyltransferase-isomerase [Tannerellaceae bacterium]
MTTKTRQIRIDAYDYALPDERIARYPLQQRDESKLLVYRGGTMEVDCFRNITQRLPEGALLVFNNTRVIRARLLFRKDTGAMIEVFCLEPAEPCDYTLALGQTGRCTWHCLIGNLRKWKDGDLHKTVCVNGRRINLRAGRLQQSGDMHLVDFSWDDEACTFADILECAGVLPIPPYLRRQTEDSDSETYQTVYSSINGSVAAPTAGLHFTPATLAALDVGGFGREELTLHVGAGTFKPVHKDTIGEHLMHTEYISVNRSSIERIMQNRGRIIAVGTTSVRSLESLYYAGLILSRNPKASVAKLTVPQWMPYDDDADAIDVDRALQNVMDYLDARRLDKLVMSTSIMIAPGYDFKITGGMVTNFHQPRSTLLLLVSAFTGGDWEHIYAYALEHGFRFLSYGDSSLLLR